VNPLADGFAIAQQWLFEAAVQPLVYALGLGGLVEDAFVATGWLMLGVLQIAFIWGVLGALERWRPVEPITDAATVRTDVLYTLIHRLGVFRLGLFFTVDPLFDEAFGWLRAQGWQPLQPDALLPGVTDIAWVSLLMYWILRTTGFTVGSITLALGGRCTACTMPSGK
jgi:sterol desaturase/sphingolipid hydroxylase (fatty acid hydroxylase superfamily)